MNSVALRNHLDLLVDDANRNRAEEAAESWAGLSQYVDNNCQLGEDFALTASILLAKDDSLLDFLAKSLEQQGMAHTQAACTSQQSTCRPFWLRPDRQLVLFLWPCLRGA